MTIVFASDIHGSQGACEAVLRRCDAENADRLVLLGDLLYHGARNDPSPDYAPKAVTRLLNEYRLRPLCVRGNCDAEIDQMVLDFPIMADYMLLPLSDKTCAFVTHGHLYNLAQLPPLGQGDLLIHGHTHVPAVMTENGVTYLNPGSCAMPKEGNPPSYMLFINNIFIIKRLDGETMMEYHL